jgi:multidrug efflux pump
MAEKQQELAKVVLKDPAVESLSSFIGIDGTNSTLNSGRFLINLKPQEERDASAVNVIRRLQRSLDDVHGIKLYMQPVQDLSVDASVSRTQYHYTLESSDLDEVNRYSSLLVSSLSKRDELVNVSSDQQDKGLRLALDIDRDTASRMGISPQLIDDTLYDAFGQRQVSNIFTQLNQYHVILAVKPEFQTRPDNLGSIYLQSITGGAVPLRSISTATETTGPLVINRQGQFPAVTISFDPAPGVSLGAAVNAVESTAKDSNLPQSIKCDFTGTAQAFQSSLTNEWILILAALIVVYIVLGVLYESYIHPITILSTLPSAGLGAVLALLMFRTELTVIAIIGIILLIGIVKKNGIMMVDFALDSERNDGKSPRDAIYQACLLRFRPIMMTTMAALLGAIPLAMGTGVGSELRHPLGISIVGGLIISQMLTLYTTPVIYLAFDRLGHHKKNSPAATVPETVIAADLPKRKKGRSSK